MTEQFSVKKTDKPIDWTVTVPGSKSMTNRALLMAALTDGTVQRSVLSHSPARRIQATAAN